MFFFLSTLSDEIKLLWPKPAYEHCANCQLCQDLHIDFMGELFIFLVLLLFRI